MIMPRSRLVDLWDRMQASYWFLPFLMFLIAVVVAIAMVRLDVYVWRNSPEASRWFPSFEAEAARSILSTIASGMLTVTGIVFSLTIVSLQLASSQFGPRLLRTFMTSRANQLVLGTFTATFIYCLIVNGTVRGHLDFVPQLATAGGILLGIIDIAVLIFFIHHVATSIRVESVIANITEDLHDVIEKLFPSQIGEPSADPREAEHEWREPSGSSRSICSRNAGYIRHIDDHMLLTAAREQDLILRIERTPGDFVVEGVQLASAWPAERVSDETQDQIRLSVVLGPDRTPRQDVGLAIRQLVEVALRALSPGINDPFTALECINRLGEGLCRVVRRHRPSRYRTDVDDRIRVIAEPVGLATMTRAAFDPIARAGGGNGDVMIRLLETVVMVAFCANREDDRTFLIDYARALKRQSDTQLPLARDRAHVAERFAHALQALERSESPPPSGDVAAVPERSPEPA